MEYVIGIVLIIGVLIAVGVFLKKKYYAEIDRLEAWKVEVMNRPVLDEVGKIKQLNMAGQAEEYFEQWRQTWDGVVTIDLPNVEELLYDAEEYVEKFRFSKAKGIFEKIEDTLNQAEEKTEKMVKKLHEVMTSEEKNRQDILQIHDQYKSMKKKIISHRHSYGASAVRLEEKLEEVNNRLEAIYFETENGNYLVAREMIIALIEEIGKLEVSVEKIPLLLNECQNQLPSQIKTIKDGIMEMQKNGYYLDHIGFHSEIEKMEKQLETHLEFLKNGEITDIEEGIDDIKDSIDIMYDLLEKEVDAKKFITNHQSLVQDSISSIDRTNQELQKEVDDIKLSYHLLDSDEATMTEMSKKLDQLKKSISLIVVEGEKNLSAYSSIKEKLEEIIKETAEIEQKQLEFSSMLHALRKDELEAHDKLSKLKSIINETNRSLSRSNLPGVPDEIHVRVNSAIEILHECFILLEQKPLSMGAIRQTVQNAETEIQILQEEVTEMIESVYFIEKIIQYGNRYRRSNLSVDEGLRNAEKAFRQFDYKLALEEAASAVELAEPGALKKIEEIINEEELLRV